MDKTKCECKLQFLLTFGVLSILTVGLGTWTMIQGGLERGIWLRNPIAWQIGAILCAISSRVLRNSPWILFPAILFLAASLAGSGLEGVHRWISLGPVQINAAALTLPLILTLAPLAQERFQRSIILAGTIPIAMILAWQPDLSQLAAYSGAILTFVALRHGRRSLALAAPVTLVAFLLCLGRPDPLEPVPHVEGIVFMAWAQSPVKALFLCAGLLLTAVSPLRLWQEKEKRDRVAALSVYFLTISVAWLVSPFPVPLAGYGISFILGWWLGVCGLMADSPGPTPALTERQL